MRPDPHHQRRGLSRPLTLTLLAIGATVLLCALFPGALAFVELAARELRYFWWLVLIVALAVWLIFFFGKRR